MATSSCVMLASLTLSVSYSCWFHRAARARSLPDEPPVISPALLMTVPSMVTTLYRSPPVPW